jgi:monoamine oxidase
MKPTHKNQIKNFVIVGAGIAGLYLSYQLLKKGHTVLLVEKDKRLGGRMFTEETEIDGEPLFMETGAGVIRNDEDDMRGLLDEFGIKYSFWKSKTDIIYHHEDQNELLDFNYKKILSKICKGSSNQIPFIEIVDDAKLSTKEKIGVTIGTSYSELFYANSKDVCEENDFNEFLLNGKYEFGKPTTWNELTNRLEEEIIQRAGKILKRTSVVQIGDGWIKTHGNKKYEYDELIITCPYHFVNKMKLSNSLRSWKDRMDQFHNETDYLRIYSYFEEPLGVENKIATNLGIRRIIPIHQNLVMTVYTDGRDANEIYKIYKSDKNGTKLSLYIREELRRLLGREVPEIKKNWCFFWPKGISNWNPSEYSVEEIVESIRNPVDHIYFCGDTYSSHPGWLEGALESCNFILDLF